MNWSVLCLFGEEFYFVGILPHCLFQVLFDLDKLKTFALFRMTYLMPEWDQTKAHPQFFIFKESGRTCSRVYQDGHSAVIAREPIPMQVFAHKKYHLRCWANILNKIYFVWGGVLLWVEKYDRSFWSKLAYINDLNVFFIIKGQFPIHFVFCKPQNSM